MEHHERVTQYHRCTSICFEHGWKRGAHVHNRSPSRSGFKHRFTVTSPELSQKTPAVNPKSLWNIDYGVIIIHIQSLYTYSPYTHTVPIHIQSLYTYSPYTHTVPIIIQSLYTYSPYTHTVPIHIQSLYTYSPYTHTVSRHIQSLQNMFIVIHVTVWWRKLSKNIMNGE